MMRMITSSVKLNSDECQQSRTYHEGLLDELRTRLKEVQSGGSPESVALHKKRGKLLPRERIAALLDKETDWLELSPLAAWDVYEDLVPAAGVITGVGYVSGRACMIVANDATVKGGTYFPLSIKKHLRAQEIAMRNRLPAIYLVDSGGVFLPKQADVFADKDAFGRIFYNQARMSALGIPQIAVVMGMCTAGGAYVPAMCDENVIVKGTGTIYLAGPPLVKAATGEEVSADALGGADLHTRLSGVSDYLAENDEEALELCRSIVENLGPTPLPVRRDAKPEDPRYPAGDLSALLPRSPKQPLEVREVLARLLDGSRFQEFKARYGSTLVCGFGHWMGHRVGILANNGILFSESSLKGAHFVQLCAKWRLPIIFLQNIPGFMVGKQVEERGIIKDGAKLVQAVATAGVPKFTVIIGASHGAGNYAMCGRAYDPRFLFTWPNSRVSVMGGQQAAQVLASIKKQQLEKTGQGIPADDMAGLIRTIEAQYEQESSPYYGTARLWDDGILEPAETRRVIGFCLDIARRVPAGETRAPVFRM